MIARALRRLRRGVVETFAASGTALRGMLANRMRASLSVLGIAIGVATLTAIIAIVQGLSVSFARQIGQLGANTLYISSRPWVIKGDWWKYRNRPKLTRADEEALRREGSLLTAVAPAVFTSAEAQYLDETASDVQVRGTTDEYIETASLKIERGRFLSPVDVELERTVTVLGSEVARVLFREGDPLGARVKLGPRYFTVVGVLKAQGKAFGQPLDNHAIVPIGVFRGIFGTRRNLTIAVTAPRERLDDAEEQIVEILRRSRGLEAGEEENFSVNRQAELAKMFNEQTAALFGVAVAVGLITLLVGGIGVMNIMLVAVTERTREIGVRRALGARRRTILLQFLLEASFVTLMGGAVGTAVGMGGARFLALVSPLSASTPPQAIVLALLFSAGIGLAFGTWPAWRAARLDPIESLRYE